MGKWGSLILTKDTKDFHINFSWKGFDISDSFFENNNPQEKTQLVRLCQFISRRVVMLCFIRNTVGLFSCGVSALELLFL